MLKGKLPEAKSAHFNCSEGCFMGKQQKITFLTTTRKLRSRRLELVHTDVWRALRVASLRGSRSCVFLIQ